jgi:cysteine desulfurase
MIYLDNAATTPVAPEVFEAMTPYLTEFFGNPSSTHSFGRKVKAAIEKVRKQVADTFRVLPAEIIFTSGGTEADNMAIQCAIHDLKVERIITSAIEHHAVLHTANACADQVKIELVKLDELGQVDLNDLERLLSDGTPTLVSLMHANNEIGNIIDLKAVALLCKAHNAYFHSDTVQTVGHIDIDLSDIPADFITCAAHKFHGPKGSGFLFVRKTIALTPVIHGGAQEREKRGGTENVAGIIGLGKALELAYADLEAHKTHVLGLKMYMIAELEKAIPGTGFNGVCSEKCLYTVLSVNLPPHKTGAMILFQLDMAGIACSGGSACSSGSNKGSHVLAEINQVNQNGVNVRFSFSRYTTKSDIDKAVSVLKNLYSK